MTKNLATFRLVLVMILLLALAIAFGSVGYSQGQDEGAKRKAIEQMRQIANAMKQCPEQKSVHTEDQCKVTYHHNGPPANLEWDVVPAKSVRSPFQGIIEFTLPSSSQDIKRENLSKKDSQRCAEREYYESLATLPAAEKALKEGPQLTWRDEHYRYEFDLGSGPPELVKMLWVATDKDNNTITQPVTYDTQACWVRAAKTGGASTEGQSKSTPTP